LKTDCDFLFLLFQFYRQIVAFHVFDSHFRAMLNLQAFFTNFNNRNVDVIHSIST
jgi:hypothetical protein